MKEVKAKHKKSSLKAKKSGPSKGAPSIEILFDKTLMVQQDGQTRKLTTEEALHWKIYQDALGGKLGAVRKVLKMIQERDAAIEKKRLAKPKHDAQPKGKMDLIHLSSTHADEALLILGIAKANEKLEEGGGFDRRQLLLEPWAVQAALSRPGGKRLEDDEKAEVIRLTADPDQIKWPKGYERR